MATTKSTIDILINESGLIFSEDSTNKDIKYKRNRIRHILMPHITEKERDLISNISNNIYLYREKYRKSHKEIELKYSHFVSIELDAFSSLDNLSKEEAIFKASSYLGNPERLSRGFLNEVYSAIETGRGRLNTAYLDFIISKKELRVFKRVDFFSDLYTSSLTEIGSFSISHTVVDSKNLLIDTSLLEGKAIIRKSRAEDVIKLKEGSKKVSELEKRAFVPFSVVLEDEKGIVAVFLRQFGANDRLSLRFLTGKGTPIRLV